MISSPLVSTSTSGIDYPTFVKVRNETELSRNASPINFQRLLRLEPLMPLRLLTPACASVTTDAATQREAMRKTNIYACNPARHKSTHRVAATHSVALRTSPCTSTPSGLQVVAAKHRYRMSFHIRPACDHVSRIRNPVSHGRTCPGFLAIASLNTLLDYLCQSLGKYQATRLAVAHCGWMNFSRPLLHSCWLRRC